MIASALAQERTDWEAVIVDDSRAPLSSSEEIMQSYGSERLRYVRSRGEHGIGHAWNMCIAEATTEFVTILHADDELAPSYGSLLLDLARRQPERTFYFCAAEIIDDRGNRVFSFPDLIKTLIAPRALEFSLTGEDGIARLCMGDFIMCPTVMYRITQARAPAFSASLRQVVDLEMYLDALFAGRRFYGTNTVSYRYRRHAESVTRKLRDQGSRFEEETALHVRIAREAAQRGMHRAARIARAMPLVRANLLLTITADLACRRIAAGLAKTRYLLR
jgi:glycosyltransferase involved in cell wall biosynthesis